ncbi:hypothetical protein GQ457_10G007100 [Hibiscus cannabinus]
MGKGVCFLLLALVLCHALTVTTGYKGDKQWREEREKAEEEETEEQVERRRTKDMFLMPRSRPVMTTDAGEMRVVRSLRGRIIDKPLHIGFITMEPHSLFIPQYLDSSLILFVRTGEARVGCIYEDEMVERRLKIGDVFHIPAGSTFYILNPGEGQRLHIICSIDPSESMNLDIFQVSASRLKGLLSRQQDGPIVHVTPSHAPSIWTRLSQLQVEDRLKQIKRMVQGEVEQEKEWSWWNLLGMFYGNGGKIFKDKAPDSYNIYKRSPDFRNDYGWSVAVDGSVYKPLKDSGTGIYLVNLTAVINQSLKLLTMGSIFLDNCLQVLKMQGSMMAPHVNPRATEYGIVLRGSGRIQIVFPNGSLAMDTKVREGDVFCVPRYFAFCQIASRSSPFEFFGFTTSSLKNRPQFLAGANSLLHALSTPELAAAFGVTEERLRRFINAQNEAVILPSASAAPPDDEDVKRGVEVGNDMIMGYD